MEHIQGDQWWTSYQTVSYNIQSKRGSRDEFKAMIDKCHAAGVSVLVDTVWNHMAGIDSGTGVAGTRELEYQLQNAIRLLTPDFSLPTLQLPWHVQRKRLPPLRYPRR